MVAKALIFPNFKIWIFKEFEMKISMLSGACDHFFIRWRWRCSLTHSAIKLHILKQPLSFLVSALRSL
jgi:hypothetical protein